MELEALEGVYPQIAEAGATLVAISPQREQYLKQVKKQHGISFALLRDEGNRVAAEFGLVYRLPGYLADLYKAAGIDLERFNGESSWSLPMPARYVIDTDLTIRAADVNPDYTQRPEPEDTLADIRNLKSGSG